jgi:hypothetical protein
MPQITGLRLDELLIELRFCRGAACCVSRRFVLGFGIADEKER